MQHMEEDHCAWSVRNCLGKWNSCSDVAPNHRGCLTQMCAWELKLTNPANCHRKLHSLFSQDTIIRTATSLEKPQTEKTLLENEF